MAQACISSSTYAQLPPVVRSARPRPIHRVPCTSKIISGPSAFKTGSPLLLRRASSKHKLYKAVPGSIRCEQGTNSKGLDVWLGRFAMVGFAIAISVEIATGKGLLENLGFTEPLPTVALAVTALVGVLTAFFIFQSAARE